MQIDKKKKEVAHVSITFQSATLRHDERHHSQAQSHTH